MTRPHRIIPSLVLAAFSVLTLAACGQTGSPLSATTASSGSVDSPTFTADTSFELPDSTTWQNAHDAGKLKIGVSYEIPGISFLNAGATVPAGFEIDLAKGVAAYLGFDEDEIEWVQTASANRELFLQNGTVDLVVQSYTITDERKKVIDFAGPYLITGQDIMVQADNEDITGPEDLAGKSVCAVRGGSSAAYIEGNLPSAELVTYDVLPKCITDLETRSVDVVSSDGIVLAGYASASTVDLRILGDPFTVVPYGIGLPLGDSALRSAIDDALEALAAEGSTDRAFEANLGDIATLEIPAVDRY